MVLQRTIFLVLLFVYSTGFLLISLRLLGDVAAGGGKYAQGEWLTDFSAGYVRRGFSGEVFMGLAEAFGVGVIPLLAMVQWVLTLLLLAGLLFLALRHAMAVRLSLLLLSPALAAFWFNNQYAPFRKEMLAYLAFLPFFLRASNTIAPWQLLLSLVTFLMAVAFHEAMAVFLVPMAIVLWVLLPRRRAVSWLACYAFGAVALTLFSLSHTNVADVSPICDRVFALGGHERLCETDAPIMWVGLDAISVVVGGLRINASETMWPYLEALAVVTAVFWIALFLVKDILLEDGAISSLILCFAAVLPLYALGADWGRWVSMQMFAFLFVALAFLKSGERERDVSPLGAGYAALILAFNLGIGIWHLVPVRAPGFVQTIWQAASQVLS